LKNKEKRASTYREKGNSNDEGTSVGASKADKFNGYLLVAFAGCANSADEWIIDSTSSFHICINKDLFVTNDFLKGRDSARLGDDSPCDIVGIGFVQIKMHDGIVRTLTDVRNIPHMSKNLISLSTLDGKGYKYSGGYGVLKVSKDSLVVMKGELKSSNLYRLHGTTITGDATAISNSPSNFDATNLSHMRLRHMSDELCKRGHLVEHSINKFKFCVYCVFGNHKRLSFNNSTHKVNVSLIMCILIYGDHLTSLLLMGLIIC
jgi:5'-3' exoribonuclease 2